MKSTVFALIGVTALTGRLHAATDTPVTRSGVEIRVHVPFAERLGNELPHQLLVRIENTSDQPLSIITEGDDSIEHLAQFTGQLRTDVESGGALELADWDRVAEIADLTVAPDQAIEMILGSAMGVTLPPEGEARLALQVGPNEVVYSNWVTLRTIPSQDTTNWPVLAAVQTTPGELGMSEFVMGNTPSGQWIFQRPVWNRSLLRRVCESDGGVSPRIAGDVDRFQAVITLGGAPERIVYFSGALGLTRGATWPLGHTGRDFINRPVSVDTPSPLGFPMALFGNGHNDSLSDERPTGSDKPVAAGQQTRFALWIGIGSGGLLVAALILVLSRGRTQTRTPS